MIRKNLTGIFIVLHLLFVSVGCNYSPGHPVLSVDSSQCKGCAKCLNVCEGDAIRIISNKAVIDPSKCIECGNCVEVCPINAIY
jgi:NAD-dependent dihydropyrimidine dehydrogenase PreA subunit